jgi:hypothetical protein
MTSLTDDAYVGTLHYKVLDPPVAGANQNLNETCLNGSTTTTDIFIDNPTSGRLWLSQGVSGGVYFVDDHINIVGQTFDKNIKIGTSVGNNVAVRTIDQGVNVGRASGSYCVNLGENIAGTQQGEYCVSLGYEAAQTDQAGGSVAIGFNAGNDTQGNGGTGECVAIGGLAGQRNQGTHSVAIGQGAGTRGQGAENVAIGYRAGNDRQQQASIAIGTGAGASRQGVNSIAIGYDCCPDTQGDDCIGIGSIGNGQPAGSVVLSAGGIVLTPANVGFYVKPIRGDTNPAGGVANSLWWNSGTSEICYHIP